MKQDKEMYISSRGAVALGNGFSGDNWCDARQANNDVDVTLHYLPDLGGITIQLIPTDPGGEHGICALDCIKRIDCE